MNQEAVDNADTGTKVTIKFLANSGRLACEETMKEFLKSLVNAIGARPLREPIIDNVAICLRNLGEEPWADEGGISGILTGSVTLSVSHVSCHTWPRNDGKLILPNLDGDAVLEVYSCRPFESWIVLATLINHYAPTKVQLQDRSDDLRWKF